MVCIGYNESINYCDIISILNKHEIYYIKKLFIINNIQYLEVETTNLHEFGLCCWGNYNEVYTERRDESDKKFYNVENDKSGNIRYNYFKAIQEQSTRKVLDDAAIWIDLIMDFVNKNNKIILYRYYSDINVNHGIIEKNTSDLCIDDLLYLDVNQILIVSNESKS